MPAVSASETRTITSASLLERAGVAKKEAEAESARGGAKAAEERHKSNQQQPSYPGAWSEARGQALGSVDRAGLQRLLTKRSNTSRA